MASVLAAVGNISISGDALRKRGARDASIYGILIGDNTPALTALNELSQVIQRRELILLIHKLPPPPPLPRKEEKKKSTTVIHSQMCACYAGGDKMRS